ncbi:SMI1/KNR4 family protein [Paenibacillus xylanilyticus]|uniref:SMI1/KNR4 family protein n=1 Tax=Paenibacillus xylanilyticus TaxID=248903 RepID=A0A7Y6EYQ8_9BACL|nr:SMI1/KNR4 family protein [Paenibacillus xylanilyticus]NUU78954.1 SMI1/KNR4 family protein [Paenibacillus xylanilyticus]
MVDNNTWSTEYSSVDMRAVRLVEEKWGIQFPSEYIKFIQKYHGAEPVQRTLNINGKKVMFSSFLTFIAFDDLDILDVYNEQKNSLPLNHFPFAIDEEGNLFCFYFSNLPHPSIIYVETIPSADPQDIYIASDFTEFMQQFN